MSLRGDTPPSSPLAAFANCGHALLVRDAQDSIIPLRNKTK
jgi:hypothetical protein